MLSPAGHTRLPCPGSGMYRRRYAEPTPRSVSKKRSLVGYLPALAERGNLAQEQPDKSVSDIYSNSLQEEDGLSVEEYGEHAAAFLQGNYTPITKEWTTTATFLGQHKQGLCIHERIPADFPNGKFAYVGPNPKFHRDHYKEWGMGPRQEPSPFGRSWHHWFEGDGMVYVLDFGREGNVTYRNRYVRTTSWKLESMEQTRLFRPLMNASGSTFMYNAVCNFLKTGSFLKDSANTAIFYYANKVLTLQDTQPPWEIDAHTLQTLGKCTFNHTLPPNVPFTAHPKVAPVSGDMIFFGFDPVMPPHCTVGAISASGEVKSLKPLWTHFIDSVFMHDFVVTENFTILYEGSMDIAPNRQLSGKNPLQYNVARKARFGIIERNMHDSSHGEVQWVECSTHQSVFHFVNAWEEMDEDDNLVLVVTGIREDGFFHHALQAQGSQEWVRDAVGKGDRIPRLHEWRITPSTKKVEEMFVSDIMIETPRINDTFTGRKNRYAYASIIDSRSISEKAQLKFNGIVKFDLESRQSELFEYDNGLFGMEAQFVPRQNSTIEDDGWLLAYVHDENDRRESALGKSYCMIFDAQDISKGPVTRIGLPERVPYGAHAIWIPSMDEGPNSTSKSFDSSKACTSIISPKRYAFKSHQIKELMKAVNLGILRGASGLFVNKWRVFLGKDDPSKYSFWRGLGFRLVETGSLAETSDRELKNDLFSDSLVTPSLTLYDNENDGSCKLVREALSILDVAVTIKPCPHGSSRHRNEALKVTGESELRLPLLCDSRKEIHLAGSEDILNFLFSEYSEGAAPPFWLHEKLAQLALFLSGNSRIESHYASPSTLPPLPLELWAYEASPFCTLVRKKLCQLELPYVLHPCARGSVRRDALQRRTPFEFQVPYLEDPNTEVSLFESDDIVQYLEEQYLRKFE